MALNKTLFDERTHSGSGVLPSERHTSRKRVGQLCRTDGRNAGKLRRHRRVFGPLVSRWAGLLQRERVLAPLENLVTMLESGVTVGAGLATLMMKPTSGTGRRPNTPIALQELHAAVTHGRALSAADLPP